VDSTEKRGNKGEGALFMTPEKRKAVKLTIEIGIVWKAKGVGGGSLHNRGGNNAKTKDD